MLHLANFCFDGVEVEQEVKLTSPEHAENIHDQNQSSFKYMIEQLVENRWLLAGAGCFIGGMIGCAFTWYCFQGRSREGDKMRDSEVVDDWHAKNSGSSLFMGNNPMRAGNSDNDLL